MQSQRCNADNPWNAFLSIDSTEIDANGLDGAKSGRSSLGDFLCSRIPLSFRRCESVIRCGVCAAMVVKGCYRLHYEDRHIGDCDDSRAVVPVQKPMLPDGGTQQVKKIKRSRKKRTIIKEQMELFEVKQSRKTKIRVTKRFHSKTIMEENNKPKKVKLEEEKHFKQKKKKKKRIKRDDELSMAMFRFSAEVDEGLCCHGSVSRTSSESSTPPSLSLGTVHTMSSPGSLATLTEHYFLPSDQLGSQSRYHIESLPWENLPPQPQSRPLPPSQLSSCEDGEVERAVQSITVAAADLFCGAEEASVVDCFLEEALTHGHQMDSLIIDDCQQASASVSARDYEERFESLINEAMSEFLGAGAPAAPQSPLAPSLDRHKYHDYFDAVKHCGVVLASGLLCHRSLLCKLHTMPQKRQVPRPENLTALIKEIRDSNRTRRLNKKQAQSCAAFVSSVCVVGAGAGGVSGSSKASSIDSSFYSSIYRCPSTTRSLEEPAASSDTVSGTASNPLGARPLVTRGYQQNTVAVNGGQRTLMAPRSLLWRDRPRCLGRSDAARDRGVPPRGSTNVAARDANAMSPLRPYSSGQSCVTAAAPSGILGDCSPALSGMSLTGGGSGRYVSLVDDGVATGPVLVPLGAGGQLMLVVGGKESHAQPGECLGAGRGQPLTVQSSTPGGLTQRFLILPDGTISSVPLQHQQQQQQQQTFFLAPGVVLGQPDSLHAQMDSSLQNLSFHQHQFQRQPQGAFFIAAAANPGVPLKRPIFLQASAADQLSSDTGDYIDAALANGPGTERLPGLPAYLQDGAFSSPAVQSRLVLDNRHPSELFAQSTPRRQSHLRAQPLFGSELFSASQGRDLQGLPPPLVVSQHLLHQQQQHSLSSHVTLHASSDLQSYQQHPLLPAASQLAQLVVDDTPFSSEYVVVQSTLA